MTERRLEVITSVERRRRWTREEKERLVAASFEPDVTASEVARSAGIHSSQLFRWRKQLCERTDEASPALLPVAVAPEPLPTPNPSKAKPRRGGRRKAGMIEIDLGDDRRVRFDETVGIETIREIVAMLVTR